MRTLVAILLAVTLVHSLYAKGHASGSVPKTQYVHAYDKSDGTHVNAYWRSPGQHSNAVSGSSGAVAAADQADWAHGIGKQKTDDPKNSVCLYKDVMSDAEVAVCRR